MTPPTTDAALLADVRAAVAVLERVIADRTLLARLPEGGLARLLQAAGHVYAPDASSRRQLVRAAARRRKAERVEREEAKREPDRDPHAAPPAGVHHAQRLSAGPAEASTPARRRRRRSTARPVEPQHCYVCKQDYTALHHFYDQLCPPCAEFNFAKRTELADLRGRVALLTGGRVKIGYQAGLKLLRAGAQLIVTTRFPRDSAARYAREPDFAEWGDRLEIFGLDLRHTPSVEAFCRELLATREPARLHRQQRLPDRAAAAGVLRAHDGGRDRGAERHAGARRGSCSATTRDCAASTCCRSGDATSHPPAPRAPARRASPGLTHAAELSQVPLLPEEQRRAAAISSREGRLDQDLQQVDLRGRNSWRLLLAEVSSVELLEVQLVNAIAPFILNARLKPLMLRTPDARQAHRERLRGRRPVLPQLQDDPPSAHQHGQGRAQHDDAHLGRRLPPATAST